MALSSLPRFERPVELWMSIVALFIVACAACGTYVFLTHHESAEFVPPPPGGIVRIDGSDTMYQLVLNVTDAYSRTYPGTTFDVKGNGSNAGIIDFLDKKIDIVDSTRAMTPDELALAQTRGMHVQEFVAAQDGLAIIVNPKNPLPSLSFDQLAEIYSSTSTTWRQFGGSNDVIHVYGRKGNSGTNSFFRHLVLNDVPYSPNMIQATDTQSIIQAVASDVSSIGYVGSGLLFDMTGNVRPDIKVVMISKDGRTYYSPLDVNAVQSRKYPLARSMYQYISSVPVRGSAIDGLLRFEMSTAGQDVIRKSDFFLNATDTIQSNQKIIDMIQ